MKNNPAFKKKFIKELCDNIRDETIGKIPLMPPEWDGHELRVYLAEQFVSAAGMSTLNSPQGRTRKADYDNAIGITEGL